MNIVTRATWGARAPRSRSLVNWPDGVDLWVHHTAGPNDQTVKNIQDFHMGPSRGWSDIGYGYLVAEDGTLYEGRGFEVHAAHSPGKNHQPSVSMIGTYVSTEPTDAQHRSVYELREFLDAGELRGHRENTGGTTCPGDGGMRKVVDGPPPGMVIKPPLVHYWEELPFASGGHGPVIVGQAAGYSKKDVMTDRLEAFKKTSPTTPVSTLQAGDEGDEDNDEARYYILSWKAGTHGLTFRSKPFRDKAARDLAVKKRELATGRKMRKFRGRQRSLYPWAS